MNIEQIFDNKEFSSIVSLEEDRMLLFCDGDVIEVLGHSNVRKILNKYRNDGIEHCLLTESKN